MITARMLYTYLKSPYQLWCDLHAPEDRKDPITEYQKLKFEQGRQHEQIVVDHKYPDVVESEAETKKDAFRELIQHMRDGVKSLHNFPVEHEDMTGYFDVLERVDGVPSAFGDYHYVVKEIKWAKNIREHHKIQAYFYNYIIGHIQGYTPEKVYLINRDEEEFEFEFDTEKFDNVLKGVRDVVNGAPITPTFGKCDWPWESYCDEQARLTNDVSLVPDVGLDKKPKLNTIGIFTVSDLAKAKVEDLVELKGIGDLTAKKIVTNAKALHSGEIIKLRDYSLPSSKVELFFDLEGLGNSVDLESIAPIDYLIGVWVRDGEEYFKYFLAEDLDKEGEMFKQFLTWFESFDDAILYHWHTYERRQMKRMCKEYGIDEKRCKNLLDKMIDLHKVATSSFAYPLTGTKIKDLAPWLGFKWRQKEVTGTETIAYYLEYVENPKKHYEKLKKVLVYNEDDCIATKVVKDWLAEQLKANNS